MLDGLRRVVSHVGECDKAARPRRHAWLLGTSRRRHRAEAPSGAKQAALGAAPGTFARAAPCYFDDPAGNASAFSFARVSRNCFSDWST
jgi:hypothetical protein